MLSQDALERSWMLSPELRGISPHRRCCQVLPSLQSGASDALQGRMQWQDAERCGRTGKGSEEQNPTGEQRREAPLGAQRGAGSGWCNLGDGDEEPKRRERRAGAGSGREPGRDGGSPFPKLDRGSGMEPVEGLEGHKAVLRRSRARDREQEGRQVRQRERGARWEDKGREEGRRRRCRSRRKDQTGADKSMDKSCTQAALATTPQPEMSML